MSRKRSLINLTVLISSLLILVPASCIVYLPIIQYVDAERIAPHSLDVLMRDYVGVAYEVEEIGEWEPGIYIGDDGFAWKVSLSEELDAATLERAGVFASPWKDDYDYYSNVVVPADFGSGAMDPNIDYTLFRAEPILGQGTICPEFHCNVYILAGNRTAFVYLSNI